MAIYSLGLRTTVTTIAAASWAAISPSTNEAAVMELGYFNGAATANVVGIGRTANTPTLTGGVAFQAEDEGRPAGQTQAAVAFGTAPTVGTPTLSSGSGLTAPELVTGPPTTGAPALSQNHALSAAGISAGAPTAGLASLAQVHTLAAAAVASGSPTAATVALLQLHALAPVAVSAGSPTVGTPAVFLPPPPPARVGNTGALRILARDGLAFFETPEVGVAVVGPLSASVWPEDRDGTLVVAPRTGVA